MPYIPRPKKIKTGSSSIDALISFLGGDDDPAQALMDTVNPAVGMARRISSKILKALRREVFPLEQSVFREAARNNGVKADAMSDFVRSARRSATGKSKVNDLELNELQQYKRQLDDIQLQQRSSVNQQVARNRARSGISTDPNILNARKGLRKLIE